MPFGLQSTLQQDSYASLNSRRKIFYQFPSGATPIMGVLSMLATEETDKVEFGWWERRFPTQLTATAASGTAPFLNGNGTVLADLQSLVAETEYRLNVVSTAQFKPTHVIEIRGVTINNGGSSSGVSVKGVVTEINSTTQLTFRPIATNATVDNATTDNNGRNVAIIGTANQEGGRSGQGILTYPVNPTNFTQIFRSAFSLTRTALKEGLKFDKSGPYKQMGWENGLRHMMEMEKAVIFGSKHTVPVTDPDSGDITPETMTGGIIWFLEAWEAANGAPSVGSWQYRPGGSAATANSDPLKRIININGGLSKADYNTYIARAFVNTNNKAYEKLAICGGTALAAINQLFEREVTKTVVVADKNRNIEFVIHSHTTLRGTIHYAVHPLFDQDPDLVGNVLIMDVGNMKWRPLSDSDTTFLKGRQETDRDGRKDEWLTEAGLELRFPESFEYLKGITGAL